MKTISLKFLAFVVLLIGIGACSLDDGDNYCVSSAYMAAASVTGPDTTPVNVPITFDVKVKVANSCGTFNRFDENPAFPKTIMALVDYVGCQCDQVASTTTQPYVFKATAAGTYVLNFATENKDAPITKTVTVTAE